MVGKTEVVGHLASRPALAQQAFGAPRTQLHGPLPGAQPGFFLEGPQQMEFGQAQFIAQLIQRQGLMQVLGKQLLGAADQAFTDRGATRQTHAAKADDFAQQHDQRIFIQFTDPCVSAQ